MSVLHSFARRRMNNMWTRVRVFLSNMGGGGGVQMLGVSGEVTLPLRMRKASGTLTGDPPVYPRRSAHIPRSYDHR